jgi:hypothetical protein
MSRRKESYKPKSFESDQNKSDTSSNIYMSMLMSESWQKLSKNAQILYVYCKAQYYAEKTKPKPQLRQLTEQEQRQCFTMNKSKWQSLYGIYPSDNGQFNKDMKQLIDNGFIELIENGKNTRTKSIYMLSNKWNKKQ